MKNFSIIANDTNKVHLCMLALMVALIFGFSNPMEVAAQAIPDSEMDMGAEPSQELQAQEESLAPLEQEQVCTAPPSGMTGWWPLDEQSGTTASDIAGYANNGSRINGPQPVTGKVSKALSFDGSNDYVEVRDHGDLDVGRGDFSIDAWVKTTDRSGVKVLVDKRYENRSTNTQGYSLFLNNGQLAFQLADSNGTWYCSGSSSSSCTNFTSGVSVADGRWHLVAVTVDRNSTNGGRFYVDGRLVRTFNPTGRQGSLDNNKPLRIGSRSSYTTGHFRGEIDEVELFKRALSYSEISNIYRAGSAGKCKNSTRKPDLTPVRISVNNSCRATITYQNIGSQSVNQRFYIKGETPSGGRISAEWPINSIGAGSTGTVTWPLGVGQAGSTLRITVDNRNQVGESNEGNNVLNYAVPARCQGQLSNPDLTIQNVSVNNSCRATITYKNVGSQSVNQRFYIKGETPSGGRISAEWPINSIGAGRTGTVTWPLGVGQAGSTLRITADSRYQIGESNEGNNVLNYAVPARCQGQLSNPDLTIQNVSVNNSCRATITYKNVGSQSVNQRFYIKGETPSGGRISAEWPINSIGAGSTGTVTWPLGVGQAGSALRITADSRYQIGESNEGNNIGNYPVPAHCQVNPPSSGTLGQFFSSSSSGYVGSVSFRDEDILAFNPNNNTWSMYFDGSDVGLSYRDIDAFHVQSDGNILFSLDRSQTLGGVNYDDSDVIKFTASSVGYNTRGSFSMYFDGSDVGLTSSNEDIDAIAVLSNGDLVLSTIGTAYVSGATARDEDMLRFRKTQYGNNTRGSWSLYLDGSDIGLTAYSEDISSAGNAGNNEVQFSTHGNYNINSSGTALQGDSDDVVRCNGTLGNNTSCRLERSWNGDSHGFGREQIDGYSSGPAPSVALFSAATADEADEAPAEAEDELAEDMLDDDEYTERVYLPLINR